MQAVQAELLSCQTALDQLSTECMEVCPVDARQPTAANATTPPCAVLALCDYSNKQVFTARCYASAVLAMGLCPSVCVCLSVTSRCSTKRQNLGSQDNTTRYPRDSSFLTPKISATFDWGHPLRGRRMQVGWSKSATFDK